MDDISALFDSVDGLKEDLTEYGTIAVGVIASNMVWNMAVARFGAGLSPTLKQYGVPAAAILAGIFGGRVVGRYNRKIGLGMTIGLVTAGVTQFARMFVPGLPVSGLGANEFDQPLLAAAPVTAEELSAVVVEEQMAGAPTFAEDVSGFQSVLQ